MIYKLIKILSFTIIVHFFPMLGFICQNNIKLRNYSDRLLFITSKKEKKNKKINYKLNFLAAYHNARK